MHRGKDHTSVCHLPVDVTRTVIPVDPDGVDWEVLLIVDVEELHHTGKVIRLARWFAYQVDVIWTSISGWAST